MKRSALFSLFAASVSAAERGHPELGKDHAAESDVGRELIGMKAEPWAFEDWMNSEPLTLAGLRGKVVLVRWWTAPGCPYCGASSEALNEFAEKHRERGLTVIGAYHHKARAPLTREHVAGQAKRLGFKFPIAIDPDWRTLRRWWLDKVDRGWTSVTFLIDRHGIVRHIHGAGLFSKASRPMTRSSGRSRRR